MNNTKTQPQATSPTDLQLLDGAAAENARLAAQVAALKEALRAFVERGVKVSGFEAAYSPWVGELVNARDLLRQGAIVTKFQEDQILTQSLRDKLNSACETGAAAIRELDSMRATVEASGGLLKKADSEIYRLREALNECVEILLDVGTNGAAQALAKAKSALEVCAYAAADALLKERGGS